MDLGQLYLFLNCLWELFRDVIMNEKLMFKNHIREARKEKKLSQGELAEMVGVSRQTISSIETGLFHPTAKLALKIGRAHV